MLDDAFANVPGFLPGVVLSAVVGVLARRRVGAWLGVGPARATAAVVVVGSILAATLTPLHEAVGGDRLQSGCDFSRVGLATLDDILGPGDIGLNILMFVPLGFVLGTLPRSGRKAALIALAALLPVAIEMTQLVIVPLDRACQSRDVADNLSGLALGLAAGFIAGGIAGLVSRAVRDVRGTARPGGRPGGTSR